MRIQHHEQRPAGIYPMLYAFWGPDGRIDTEAMRRQVEHVIAVGADGVALLGLVTESHRVDASVRLELVRLVADLIGGRVPLSVTVTGETPDAQRAFIDQSLALGADWLVLQPPLKQKLSDDALISFFAGVSAGLSVPVGVQNNPEHLLNSFTAEGLLRLHREVPVITVAKAEGPVVLAEPLIAGTRGTLASFGGHGGIEHIRLLETGAEGLIPAPDCLPLQVQIHRIWQSGDPQLQQMAREIEQDLLPLIVFMNRSIDVLLCYGRRFMARRLGLTETYDPHGSVTATGFGLSQMDQLYDRLSQAEQRWSAALGISLAG